MAGDEASFLKQLEEQGGRVLGRAGKISRAIVWGNGRLWHAGPDTDWEPRPLDLSVRSQLDGAETLPHDDRDDIVRLLLDLIGVPPNPPARRAAKKA